MASTSFLRRFKVIYMLSSNEMAVETRSAASTLGPQGRWPRITTPLPGPRATALVARDNAALSTSFTRPYPLAIERGEGCWVVDVDGNEFLDFTSGIAVTSTGHAHPAVVAAIESQARRFLHMSGTDFYYEPEVRLAERLGGLAPVEAPARVFFTNSGAESIEGAM